MNKKFNDEAESIARNIRPAAEVDGEIVGKDPWKGLHITGKPTLIGTNKRKSFGIGGQNTNFRRIYMDSPEEGANHDRFMDTDTRTSKDFGGWVHLEYESINVTCDPQYESFSHLTEGQTIRIVPHKAYEFGTKIGTPEVFSIVHISSSFSMSLDRPWNHEACSGSYNIDNEVALTIGSIGGSSNIELNTRKDLVGRAMSIKKGSLDITDGSVFTTYDRHNSDENKLLRAGDLTKDNFSIDGGYKYDMPLKDDAGYHWNEQAKAGSLYGHGQRSDSFVIDTTKNIFFDLSRKASVKVWRYSPSSSVKMRL